jgi:hypothetical protein
MNNPVVPKRNLSQANASAPSPADLTTGEIATNLTSGDLYIKLYDGSIVNAGPVKSVNGSTGNVVITPAGIGALTTSDLGNFATAQIPAATTDLGNLTIPAATTAQIGGIIAGSGLQVTLTGNLSAKIATNSSPGIVQPGSGFLVDGSGVITPDNTYVITTDSPASVFNGGVY